MAKQDDKKKQEKSKGGSKGSEKLTEEGAVPAIVEATMGRGGTRGEITQVRCKILQGKNRGGGSRENQQSVVNREC